MEERRKHAKLGFFHAFVPEMLIFRLRKLEAIFMVLVMQKTKVIKSHCLSVFKTIL